ncbi:MAG: hypothetical protein ACRD1S_05220, partial [Vicinamibacterales bacterium]
MISPRQTTLVRAPGLRPFRRAIADAVLAAPARGAAGGVAVIVPTKAAGDLLRRTLEREPTAEIMTRDEFYERLHAGLDAPQQLTAFDREVLLR